MSAANIKAGIEISAEVKGEEVVAKLAKTIEEAGIDTAALTERGKELSQTFTRLDKASALAEQFKKLKTQTQEVAAELSRAQAQTASLAREMKANPSKELEKQFKAAAAEAGRLKQRKAELAVETHNTRKALAEAGISTKNLAQEERRLAAESEKARQDLAALNEEAQKLKRLADAKIALGLHVDAQAGKEIQRLNRSYAEEVSGAAQAAQKGAQQQAAAVQGVGQAASGAVRRVTRLHEVFSTQYGNIKLTREEFAALNAEIDRFKVGQPKSMSVSRWIRYQNQLQAVKDGFAAVIRNAEAAGETVSQMARDGTISQQALARATQAAAEATGKLDAVRLSKLHAQIDEARQKLRQMQDEAREARETLEAELAGLNGDEEAAHELEARRKIEAWKKKAAEASDAGAAAEYRKSAELQEQIYRRQREKREAERQEKQRAAQKPDWEALSEPKVEIPAGVADGLMNDLNRVLEKRDANVADAAVNALMEQLAAGLRRMT